jgi:serine protease Do
LGYNQSLPLDNVVQIKCEVAYGGWYDRYGYPQSGWQGSGVFIRDNLILTAGHIVDGISDANIFTIDGKEYKAKSWYLETDADIGFIDVDTNDVESRLSFDDAKLGETVWAFGNPLGVFPILVKGIISATNAPDSYSNTKDMITTDTAINGGNSGCPLFDKWGNILGICSWHYPGQEGMNYFVRSEVIELSLQKYDAIRALERIE